ncbi:unnamed protein product [Chironomus riparius]|uniref:Secreted protein n=1 Tax=Chironomus riparius TaxID=315576 RepID=A0A9N9S2M8_9DIPT|nr:unnamed protein product [Chironomus riparius]
MKFLIAFIAFALISTAYSAGTTKKTTTAPPPPVDPVSAMVNLINTYTGTDLKGFIGNLAKSESGTYPPNVIADFCTAVCSKLTATSKITCADFTNAVQSNYNAARAAK